MTTHPSSREVEEFYEELSESSRLHMLGLGDYLEAYWLLDELAHLDEDDLRGSLAAILDGAEIAWPWEEDDNEPDEQDDLGPWDDRLADPDAARAYLAQVLHSEYAGDLAAFVADIPPELRSELLAASMTAAGSHVSPGQAVELAGGPVGEGHPASVWNLPPEQLAPVRRGASELPRSRSKNVRKRRAMQAARLRKRARKARKAR
jgi:hypothetical protein